MLPVGFGREGEGGYDGYLQQCCRLLVINSRRKWKETSERVGSHFSSIRASQHLCESYQTHTGNLKMFSVSEFLIEIKLVLICLYSI